MWWEKRKIIYLFVSLSSFGSFWFWDIMYLQTLIIRSLPSVVPGALERSVTGLSLSYIKVCFQLGMTGILGC